MKICGSIIAILYAGLMIFAIYKKNSKDISSAIIAIGGLFILAYTMLNTIWCKNFIIILIIGMINISVGTLINGVKQKNIHIHHHIIRLIVESIIIAICWIST